MLRRQKWKRRQTTFLLLILITLIVITSPFIWRMNRLRVAKSVYDVQKVQEELQWWEVHGGLLNKLGVIRDASLWVELNVGGENLESALALYQDDKHQFWLFLLNMQKGEIPKAENILSLLDNKQLVQLGQGMISLAKGDAEESSRLLADEALNWKKMSKHAQTLRHLILAQAALIIGNYQVTLNELDAAQCLEPKNPACLSLAFDLAIEEGQWIKAQELSQVIKAQTWFNKNTLFQTKKAVLAIHANNIQELSDSLSALEELPRGKACIDYVNGIHALSKGQLQEGKSLLERALKRGLEGGLKADAQKSIAQVNTRQNADRILRSIVVGNGYW
ncbi:MAG: hypothetical protein ACOYIB_08540 [Desulfosporosinus sp.]|jgi:hypothetical protein